MHVGSWVTVAVLCLSASAARAQGLPALPEGNGGNLRVDVRCADYWATPGRGLQLTIDGAPVAAAGINETNVLVEGKHGDYLTTVPTDIGFDVAPGPHHLELAAPGCASEARDITSGLMPTYVQGRLAITDSELRGATNAPNGIGFALGAIVAALPGGRGVSDDGSSFTRGRGTATGVWMSTMIERRRLAIALDNSIEWGGVSGTTTGTSSDGFGPPASAPTAYTANELQYRAVGRIGVRVPLHAVALSAGTGVGLSMTFQTSFQSSDVFAVTPGFDATWFLPVWAAVTVKPWCNAGVQVLASYDLHPGDSADNGMAVAAGLMWQPNDACSEAPGLRIR